MLADRDDILRYIPQRHPVVMVHDLIAASDDQAITQFAIEPDNIFIDKGLFAEPGLLKHCADSSRHIGYSVTQTIYPYRLGILLLLRN